MLVGNTVLVTAAITVGIVLLFVLYRRQTIRKRRSLGARLERVQRRHGF